MNPTDKIYIAGHRGLVGSALMRNLGAKGYTNLLSRTHAELDLTDQGAVAAFFQRKLLDVTRLHSLGWSARLPFREGLLQAYRDFLG